MMRRRPIFLALSACLLLGFGAQAQNAPVPKEAESGTLGADWLNQNAAGVQYVTITPTSTINSGNPGTAARVITYSVTFPGPGTYDLYMRMRIGPAGANDDSFFYGNGFGTKAVADDNDWITCNNLNAVGYTTASGNVAVDGAGGSGTGVWKWLNVSQFNGGEAPISFTVTAGNLTQTFQLGAREDGFDIDKFTFGAQGRYFTVANLDAGAQGSTTPPTTFTPSGPPIAQGKPKYLGGIYSTAQAPYFANYWNQVTPENGGKWGSVEATRGTYNWTEVDAAYALAQANGFPFRYHVLLWGSQQPTWMQNLSAADQLAAIDQWMTAVAQHFPNLDLIEVVNEPLHAPPLTVNGVCNNCGNYYNALGGAGTTGWDWVITAFQMARTRFPNARLMLNDYSVENTATSAQNYQNIVNLLVQRNLIDAVGIQGHAFSTKNTTAANLTANLNTIAAPGKPLYITELDIDGVDGSGNLDDAVQLIEYQRVFPVFWTHPAVRGVTTWGYRPGHWRTTQGAYLANADNTERAALVWLRQYVQSTQLAVKGPKATTVQIYPNPSAGGRFTLNGTSELTKVRVLDMQGRLVQERAVSHQDIIDLQVQAAPGMYIVQLHSPEGFTTGKLVVE